jgi:hypothetical protein
MEISENGQHQPVTQEFHLAVVTSGINLVKLFCFVMQNKLERLLLQLCLMFAVAGNIRTLL